MAKNEKPFSRSIVINSGHSKFEISNYNHFWTIDHLTKSHSLDSLPFTNEMKNDLTWKLVITKEYLNFPRGGISARWKIRPVLESRWTAVMERKFGNFIKVDYVISEVNQDGTKMTKIGSAKNVFFMLSSGGWPKVKSHLICDDSKSEDRSVRIFCEIVAYYKQQTVVKHSGFSSLSNDFSSLLTDSQHNDMTIQCKTQEFRAHKAILSARSPVFKAMFDHNMRENQQNHIMLDDIGGRTLEAMLKFIYTDKTEDIEDLAEDLLVAADKYQLDKLKLICEETLMRTLTKLNAARVAELADLLNCIELEECAKRCLSKQVLK